ncbi:MAG: BACON domain-containing protein [Bacteroidales bacterium]|nr:BACON domain-containing protein [Bacteroidales bacterium]
MECKLALAALVAMLGVQACDKPYEYNLPLSVTAHNLTLPSDAGSTHIMVYASGEWKASLAGEVDWAALSKLSGEGVNDLVFSYSANYGIARRVGVVLESGSDRDTVFVTQKGPVTSPSFKLEYNTLEVLKNGGLAFIPGTSNLYYSTEAIRVTAIYTDASGKKDTVLVAPENASTEHWIVDAVKRYDRIGLDVSPYSGTGTRSADLVVSIDDPTGRNFRSLFTVKQNTDSPMFVLSSISGTYNNTAAEYTAKCTLNNIYPYSDDVFITCKAGWIHDIRLTKNGLMFSLDANNSGAMRSAQISVNFIDLAGKSVKGEFTVLQKA